MKLIILNYRKGGTRLKTENDIYFEDSLDFLSKYCKNNSHNECSCRWSGLGFQIICYCGCHKKNSDIKDVLYQYSCDNKSANIKSYYRSKLINVLKE